MSISTGRYIITNVKQHNLAYLADPNDGSPLTANFQQGDAGEKWNVTQLGNGNYIIQNVGNASYANSGNRSKEQDTVEGRSQVQQWFIQETRVKRQYTIATTDSRVYWGLVDNQTDIPIALSGSAVDPRNWWTFQQTD